MVVEAGVELEGRALAPRPPERSEDGRGLSPKSRLAALDWPVAAAVDWSVAVAVVEVVVRPTLAPEVR